jgi:hypothetical protein
MDLYRSGWASGQESGSIQDVESQTCQGQDGTAQMQRTSIRRPLIDQLIFPINADLLFEVWKAPWVRNAEASDVRQGRILCNV